MPRQTGADPPNDPPFEPDGPEGPHAVSGVHSHATYPSVEDVAHRLAAAFPPGLVSPPPPPSEPPE